MKVAVYCRVSTEDQADAKTIENQVAFAKKYCDLHGLQVHNFYLDDGVSGSIPVEERPAGQAMLADAKEGFFQAVYVYRLDRLARTTLDILTTHHRLAKLNIGLKSMTENFDTSTPSGKFFLTTLAGIAEIERSTIAERMRLGKERAVKEGRWPGGPPPYGYRVRRKRLEIFEPEAAIVRKIFSLYTDRRMNTVSIADYLTALGYETPGGSRKKGSAGVWRSSGVWGILTNPAYKGTFIYGKQRPAEKQEGFACPAIVNDKQWERAQQRLKENFFNAGRNAKRHYLLRGLIRCGVCGRNYCGDGSHSKGRYHYYRCTGNSSFRGKLVDKCPAKSVRADQLEQIVWQDILNYILKNDNLIKKLQLAVNSRQPEGDLDREAKVIKKALLDKEREKGRVLTLFRKGLINDSEIEKELEDLAKDFAVLQERLSRFKLQKTAQDKALNRQLDMADTVKLLEKKVLKADILLKRKLISALVASITVNTVKEDGKEAPLITISYSFPECIPGAETRGKHRLGIPKSSY
ncbi:recombinase family protein [Desulfofalx alkaliphila]|uniref:recombinase family protein n=1 Tax=Desulfofalx alkaliphila TaxID=105483 RepID=UPI00068D93D8|nr:recombinase family protein [Desulfofalx alkaliphila]